MAELIDMEKVAGRYQSKHDLMQDIPQSKNAKVEVRDHYGDDDDDGPGNKYAPRSSSNSNAKTKAQSNTYNHSNTENVFTQNDDGHDIEVQTKAITSQGHTLNEQTGLMKEQSNKLDDLNVTMDKLYDLLYREHTRPVPKYQQTGFGSAGSRLTEPDANGQANGFGSITADIMDMIGNGREKKAKGGRKVPKVQTTGGGLKGFGGKMWGAAKNLGGSISGLGEAGEGLGSRIMSGAKGMLGGGGGGWRGKLAKGVLGAGAAAVGYKGLESLGGLGAVSAMFESGKGGVGTISTGKGDHGGVSYGAHQLSSKSGTMAKFLRSEQGAQYADKFAGLTPGSPEFNAAYKQVVGNDAKGFEEAQAGFMKATHYDPAARKLQNDTGLDVSKRSRALQELVYSTSTQYGGGSSVLAKALEGKDANSMSDEELISTMQDYKRDNVANNFKSSSAAVQASVAKRAENEKATLQKILADEKKNPQGVLKGAEVKGVDGKTATEVVEGKVPASDTTIGIMPMKAQDVKADSALSDSEEPEVTTEPVGMSTTDKVGVGLAVGGVAKTGVDVAKGASAAKGVVTGAETIGVKSAAKGAGKLLGPVASIGIDGYRAAEVINDETMAKQNKERELAGIGGSMAGAAAGGAIGAVAGSVVPVVGNVVGGIGGAIAGSIVGEEGVKAGMDYMLGTPEERQAKAAQGMVINSPMLQGEHSTLPSAPVVLPSVKDLMTVPGKPSATPLSLTAETPKPLGTPVAAPETKVSGAEAAAMLAPTGQANSLKVSTPESPVPSFSKAADSVSSKAVAPKPTYDNERDVLKATTLPVMPNAPSFAKAAQNVEAGSTDKLAAATQSLADSAAKLASVQPGGTKPGMPGEAPAGMPALDAKPAASPVSLNPSSPASPAFYKSEPVISQRASAAAAPIAKVAPTAVAAMPAPEPATRQPFDTVQNVRMAVDQPQSAPAPSGGGKPAAGGGGGKGSDKPTLDEFPALINDFGLIFVNSGFI